VGTDDNSPIKTSAGSPIYGRMVPGSIWQQFMSAALRGKPKEQFSKFVPLGTPPDDSDATETDDPNSDNGDGHHHGRHHGDNTDDSSACDFVACDDNGNPIGRSRNGDDNSDSGDN
jgi:membrane peptidoglycan carboxypeptidase